MGALFSLTPPLLQAADDIKRLLRKYCRSAQPSKVEGSERSPETILGELRADETQKTAAGLSPDDRNESKP